MQISFCLGYVDVTFAFLIFEYHNIKYPYCKDRIIICIFVEWKKDEKYFKQRRNTIIHKRTDEWCI